MDHSANSDKIRTFVQGLVKDAAGAAGDAVAIDRAVVVALSRAHFDAVRAEWGHWCEANPELKPHMAVARKLMLDAGYGEDLDPICGLPGAKPMVAKIDGLEAVSFEHSMGNVMPLSAIFLNKVREVMDAAAAIAAAEKQPDQKSAEPKQGE